MLEVTFSYIAVELKVSRNEVSKVLRAFKSCPVDQPLKIHLDSLQIRDREVESFVRKAINEKRIIPTSFN